MRETGEILSIAGKTATIQLNRGEKCDGCQACNAFGENKMQLDAQNDIGAKVGDVVEVDVEPKEVIASSMIVFIFPLVMMLGGYFAAVKFLPPHSEGVGVLGSLGALVLAFVFIKMLDKRRNPNDLNPAVIINIAPKISVN